MRLRTITTISILWATALSCSEPAAIEPGRDYVDVILIGGIIKRGYRVHVPPRVPSRPAPLIIAFHGLGIDAERMERHTGLDAEADAAGAIVVYPYSYAGGFDYLPQNLDVPFTRAIIARLSDELAIDRGRIIAVGLSNGGLFVQGLGCLMADQLAGFVSVSATMPRGLPGACIDAGATAGPRVSAKFVLGTADPFYPVSGSIQDASIDESLDYWGTRAGCSAERSRVALPDTAADGTTVYRSKYTQCSSGRLVELDSVVGGGHGWPGAAEPLNPAVVGVTSRNLSANRAIVEFLAAIPSR